MNVNRLSINIVIEQLSARTVDHLSKYLAMRLTLDLDTDVPEADRLVNFCIYIAPQSQQLLVLNGNQTLQQVIEKFWKVKLTLLCAYTVDER